MCVFTAWVWRRAWALFVGPVVTSSSRRTAEGHTKEGSEEYRRFLFLYIVLYF